MTTEDQIYASFMERADVRPGGEIFLHGGAALEFVAACENAGIAILGIEGARLSSTEVVPYVDVIADFSPRTKMEWDAYRERSNRLALDFLGRAIEEKGADVSFCFELLDRAEYLDCLAKIFRVP